MNRILMVKELKSPARDLPAGISLVVGLHLGADVAEDLIAKGYAVEQAEETQEPERKRQRRKRGEG